jgi:hypothetical protein
VQRVAAMATATAAPAARPLTRAYDYLVIGGGSGGLASARRASSYGASVALVESGRLGGTCVRPRRALGTPCAKADGGKGGVRRRGQVNVGCVPKKVMSNTAGIAEALHDAADYGFDVTVHGFDWAKIKAARDAYVLRLNGIYASNLEKDRVQYVRGHAAFVAPNTVQLDDGQMITGKHVLIATGAHSTAPSAGTTCAYEYIALLGLTTARGPRGRRTAVRAADSGGGALCGQRRFFRATDAAAPRAGGGRRVHCRRVCGRLPRPPRRDDVVVPVPMAAAHVRPPYARDAAARVHQRVRGAAPLRATPAAAEG